MEDKGMRINKYLSDAGVCSRREADRETEAGHVMINGRTAVLGDRIFSGDVVSFQGQEVKAEAEKVLLAYNKPAGIVCTAEKREKNNIVDYIDYPVRIYPVGRLDKDSEGLIFLTNDGGIVNKIMRAGNFHEKEYVVTVDKEVTGSFLQGMAGGVFLKELDRTTRKCTVKKLGKKQFSIILTQGLNRQIRRMCEYFGYHVVTLKRVRIMNVKLGDLKTGAYRELTQEEMRELKALIRESSNETVIYKSGD